MKETNVQLDMGLDLDWKQSVQTMLSEVIAEEELPVNSLFLYTNYGRDGVTVTSYSICIYEPDYPVVPNTTANMSKNDQVLNMKEKGFMLELIVPKSRIEEIGVPNEAVVKEIKSDDNNKHIHISADSPELIAYLKANVLHAYKNYESKESHFGCCNLFEQCSDAKKCIHENKLFSKGCAYRRNLEAGKIFYGKNKTI